MKLNQTKLIGSAKYQISDKVTVYQFKVQKFGYWATYRRIIPIPVNGVIRDIRVKKKSKLGVRFVQYLVEFPQKDWSTRQNTRSQWISEEYISLIENPSIWKKIINKIKSWLKH